MSIRPARAEDITAILALDAELHEPHREHHPELFNAVVPERDRAVLQAELANEDMQVLLAEQEGTLIGFLRVVTVRTPEGRPLRARRFALVDDLVVSKPHRRRGVAAELLHAAEAWAKERGLESLEVTVWSFNESAQRLYEAQGFTPLRQYWRKPL